MGNVIDYLIQYGDQAFAERAFCDVDVLILAQLSYFDFGSAVPTIAQHKKSVTLEEIDRTADLSAVFADKWYGENNRKLWNALLAGRRFRTMRCNYYRERMEEEQEAQFGAVTFFPEGCRLERGFSTGISKTAGIPGNEQCVLKSGRLQASGSVYGMRTFQRRKPGCLCGDLGGNRRAAQDYGHL